MIKSDKLRAVHNLISGAQTASLPKAYPCFDKVLRGKTPKWLNYFVHSGASRIPLIKLEVTTCYVQDLYVIIQKKK